MEPMETKSFCAQNAALFTKVNDTLKNTHNIDADVYNCLDYEKILNTMCEYLTGYMDYLKSGDTKYDGKILDSTVTFYDSIFTSIENRREIILKDFEDINEQFLSKTKALQDTLDKCLADVADNHNRMSEQIYHVTNRQYRKLARVYHDDMKLVLWIRDKKARGAKYGTDGCYNPGSGAISAFYDKTSPVIHEGVIQE